MKKVLLFFLGVFILCGCKKSAMPSLSTNPYGKFVEYRIADTVFLNNDRRQGIAQVTVETETGDTAYYKPGTSDYSFEPNLISNYSASWAVNKTLDFVSSTVGSESGFDYEFPDTFIYSLQTGSFNDGSAFTTNTYSVKDVISQPNPNTIKLLIITQSTTSDAEVKASFYKKM